MSTLQPDSDRPSFVRRLLRALRIIVRSVSLMFFIALSVGVGVALYYGVPALYREYIQPAQENVARVDDLEARLEGAGQQTTQRLNDLQTRLETLELQGDTGKETLGGLQAGLDALEAAQATQQARLATLESADRTDPQTITQLRAGLDQVATLQTQLNAMATAQATQQIQTNQRLESAQTALETMQSELAGLQAALDQNSQDLQALKGELVVTVTSLTEQERNLQLLRIFELLTRSRLSLAQEQLGPAEQDLQAGRDLLLTLLGQLSADQALDLVDILARLDAALENLADAPDVAAEELGLAWQLLIQALPAGAGTTPSATTATATATATPTPTVTTTPTPTRTSRP